MNERRTEKMGRRTMRAHTRKEKKKGQKGTTYIVDIEI